VGGRTERALRPAARSRRRFLAARLALVAGAMVLAGCGGESGSGSGGPPTGPASASGAPTTGPSSSAPASPSVQVLTQLAVEQDISALDRGVLTYRLPAAVQAGTPFVLNVTVTDVGKARPGVITATEASQQLGLTVFPKDVPAGAFVGLTQVSCTNLTCQSLNSQPSQPVIGEGSSRTWSWMITPGSPGPASLVVNATTFEGQSSSSLSQVLVPITMKVTATTGFIRKQHRQARRKELASATGFLDTTTGLITSVGGAIAVLAGGAAWVSRRRKRRHPGKAG
jgi:hypothetical protein